MALFLGEKQGNLTHEVLFGIFNKTILLKLSDKSSCIRILLILQEEMVHLFFFQKEVFKSESVYEMYNFFLPKFHIFINNT